MAIYVATSTIYPTVGEVVAYFAVKSGLVSATEEDLLYEQLKPFVREQKGKDFAEFESILDVLQDRLEGWLSPQEIGNLTFLFFRRFLEQYKILIRSARGSAFGRATVMAQTLIPNFFVPQAAFILRNLSRNPFDFFDLNALLRSAAPLKIMLEIPLKAQGKSWHQLAELYGGKHSVRGDRPPDHDVDDKRKLIQKWGTGKATPDLSTCLALLDALDWSKYSGFVFWVWIARFIQKVDIEHRILVADAIQADMPLPELKKVGREITEANDAFARTTIGAEAVAVLRTLSALLLYDTVRNYGDQMRVETLMAQLPKQVAGLEHVRYYVTWLEARYLLYSRNYDSALKKYEQAFYEGMYGDTHAETMILFEWAALAQKQNAKTVLKRIDSRMKFLNVYPIGLDAEGVATLRLKAFRENFGAGRHFIESF